VAWSFSHSQSWAVANAQHGDSRDLIIDLASKWLEAPGTHPEKSGVINFSTPEGEVVAARRVVTTTLHGLSVPQHISELIFTDSHGSCAISLASRDFPLNSDPSGTLPVLDEFDAQFFRAIDEGVLRGEVVEGPTKSSVDGILEALESSGRQRWLAIIGPFAESEDKKVTPHRLSTGLGVICDVLVVDEELRRGLNDELGLGFSIPLEGIRLFGPGFNVESDLDSRNNPVLSPIPWSPVSNEIDIQSPAVRVVAVRCVAIAHELSSKLVTQSVSEEVIRKFSVAEGNNIRAANTELIGQDSVERDQLVARIDQITNELLFAKEYATYWETEHASLQISLSDIHADLYVTNSLFEDEHRSNTYLRKKLAAFGEFDSGIGPEADFWSDVPNTFEELILRCNEIPFVRFTGSDDPYQQLDNQPRMEVCVSRAWGALHGLSDYARLKKEGEFSGGLHEYMNTGIHSGHKIGPNALAMSEGEQVNVNPAFKASRTFPVPEEVGGDGEIFMEAHVKLVTGSNNSPRMHFFDNSGGDGLIYVGYIGKHLPNPGTN
jgi:hypothetical protein